VNLSAETAFLPTEHRTRYRLRHSLGDFDIAAKYGALDASSGDPWGNAFPTEFVPMGHLVARTQPDFQVSTATGVTQSVFLIEVGENRQLEPGTAPHRYLASITTAKITQAIRTLVEVAKEERFQDGLESNLSLGLTTLIERYPSETIAILNEILRSLGISYFIHAEILQLLGRIESAATKEGRFSLLISYLRAKSPIVRDAAGTALACMNDQRAISYLQRAIETEPVPTLREDMAAVVDQLKQ